MIGGGKMMDSEVKERNKKVMIKGAIILSVIIAAFVLLFVIMSSYHKREANRRQIEYRETFRNYADEFDAENYRKEKERLGLSPSEPVSECGAINVGGDEYYLGMTMQEIVDLGYLYHEWLDGDEIGRGSLVLYLNDEDARAVTPVMLNCSFDLAEGGDADSYEDYVLSGIHLGEVWLGGSRVYYDGRISYNAEVIHGIRTDMSYWEIMDILEPYEEKGQLRIELFGSGDNTYLIVRVIEGGVVYVYEFWDMHLRNIHMFEEEDMATTTDKLKWKFSKWFGL